MFNPSPAKDSASSLEADNEIIGINTKKNKYERSLDKYLPDTSAGE